MKHTVIDHLQQISHVVRNVRKYEQDEDIHRTGSYENLCNYLITREIEHIEDQTTLVQGEVANSAVTDGKLEYLQYEIGKSCHQKLRTRGCPGHHCRCYGTAKEGHSCSNITPSCKQQIRHRKNVYSISCRTKATRVVKQTFYKYNRESITRGTLWH